MEQMTENQLEEQGLEVAQRRLKEDLKWKSLKQKERTAVSQEKKKDQLALDTILKVTRNVIP